MLQSSPILAFLPFGALLVLIAVLPLVAAEYWDSNRNKAWIAAGIAGPVAVAWLTGAPEHVAALIHALEEYVSFIVLLAALYVISGGIVLRGDIRATPATNLT